MKIETPNTADIQQTDRTEIVPDEQPIVVGLDNSGDEKAENTEIAPDEQPITVGLGDEDNFSSYCVTNRTTEDLEIDKINHFTDLPDYQEPIDSEWPIVVRTGEDYFCLDGWSLIEGARANGMTSIKVEVDHIGRHSRTELGIRKAALRNTSRTGKLNYGEDCRNIRYTLRMVIASDVNMRLFGHGGNRISAVLKGTEESKDDDALEVLCGRFRKERASLNINLNHSEYLSDEAMNYLAEMNAKKDFFVKFQSEKTKLAKEMKKANQNDQAITMKISGLVFQRYDDHLKEKDSKGNQSDPVQAITGGDKIANEVIKTIKKDIGSISSKLAPRRVNSMSFDELANLIETESRILADAYDWIKRMKPASTTVTL